MQGTVAWWRRLPVLLGAALIVLPWAYLMWNATVGELAPRLRFRTKQTLIGAFATPSEPGSQSMLDGGYQRAVSEAVGRISPIYGTAVPLKAQFYYSVLSMSPYKLFGSEGLSILLVQPGGDLYQWPYLVEYCTRDTARFRPAAEAWAARLRQLQDSVEARGQAFLYLTTPSKPSTLPGHLSPSLRCPAPKADRLAKVAIWHEILRRHGVRFVDGAGLVAEAQQSAGIDMFPRGGIHWNYLAAAITARAVTDAINLRRPMLTPFTYSWTRSRKPEGSDRDMIDAMTMMWPDDDYEVPLMTYASTPPAQCRPARIVEVGGSFLFQVNHILSRVDCPPVISQWFYWSNRHVRFPGDVTDAIDPELRRRELREAEIVLVEENESAFPNSEHLKRLMEASE